MLQRCGKEKEGLRALTCTLISMLLSMPAGRSIKAGLTACDIVSKWTWAATLLQVGLTPLFKPMSLQLQLRIQQ